MNRWVIFAEGPATGVFDPLDQMRPPFLLRNGVWTVAGRWISLLHPTSVAAAVRPWLKDALREQTGWTVNQPIGGVPTDVWLIVGTASPRRQDYWQGQSFPTCFSWASAHDAVIRLDKGDWARYKQPINQWIVAGGVGECPCDFAKAQTDIPLAGAAGLWDMVNDLPAQLDFDWHLWHRRQGRKALQGLDRHPSAVVIADHNICVAEDVYVGPQALVDASSGPIILDRGVAIEPFTRLNGPAYIGPFTRLVGGKISGGCALGAGCKIGGEVEASIVQGFSNKVHEGFFGHGFIGEWVNLGALTTNSDLKNTYGAVRVARGGRMVDTGSIKVGSYLSDHTKTAIGTLMPTGAVIGVGVNITTGGLTPKSIPPFVWGGADTYMEHDLDRMLQTADAVIQRRAAVGRSLGRPGRLTTSEAAVLRTLFERSASERRAFIGSPPS